LTVVERHGQAGGAGHGLLQGFGLKSGAVASSVGHDAHNIIIAGTNEADMKVALSALKDMKGGICVIRERRIVECVELPIAGLMSEKRAADVAKETAALKKAWVDVGCTLPFMGFNLLSLSAVPEIRLTDRGLVLLPEMKLIPLFEPEVSEKSDHELAPV
jgi:adenine deaminase